MNESAKVQKQFIIFRIDIKSRKRIDTMMMNSKIKESQTHADFQKKQFFYMTTKVHEIGYSLFRNKKSQIDIKSELFICFTNTFNFGLRAKFYVKIDIKISELFICFVKILRILPVSQNPKYFCEVEKVPRNYMNFDVKFFFFYNLLCNN